MNFNVDENSSYNLVCKYCETDTRFSQFNEFLDHAQSTHGPTIGVSAVAIVPEGQNKPCSRINSRKSSFIENKTHSRSSLHGNSSRKKCSSSKCHETASSESINRGPSTSACSRAQTPYTMRKAGSTTSTVVSLSPVYDLGHMKRSCLVEMITLLSKCICIWHKPTRVRMSRKERFQGYQLLLRKLQDYEPNAKFRDVRSIVRQLITGFFNQMNGEISEDDEVNSKDDDDINPLKSKSIFEQLMFLTNCEKEDLKEMNLSKVCSFCAMNFYSPEALFTHMLNNHLPEPGTSKTSRASKTLGASGSVGTAETSNLITTSQHGAGDASDIAENSARKSKSCTSTRHAFEHEMDYCTDHSLSEWEHRSVSGHFSSRKSKSSTPLLREPRVKRYRRSRSHNSLSAGGSTDGASNADTDISVENRRSRNSNMLRTTTSSVTSNTDTDISIGETSKTSRHYLGEYDDKFLEEFIELYRQHECLWRKDSGKSHNRKEKSRAYEALAAKYRQDRNLPTMSISKIKKFIARLRRYYDRLRKPNANLHRRHIWQRLSFIDEGRRRRRSKSSGSIAAVTATTSRSRSNVALDCQQCSRHYKRLHNYSSHMLRMHPPRYCNPCNQHFDTADDLRQHLLQQHVKTPECPLCPNAQVTDWRSPQHLAEHFYDHKCPSCTKVFYDGQKFAAHKANCLARFRCSHCNAVFMGTHEFRRHSREMHQEHQPFKCDKCQKRYKFLAPLIRHQRWHERMQRT